MARTVAQINAQIVADWQADQVLGIMMPAAPQLPSKRSFWGAVIFIFATATFVLEGLLDVFTSQNEAIAANAAAANKQWLTSKAFAFQYDAVTPQVIQMINGVPQYPVVDPTKCIISQVSVSSDISNNTLIKVATGSPPAALDSLQLTAIQSYFDTIGTEGITYLLSSGNPDQLYVDATIFFDGQYQAIIQQNVIDAITAFLANLSTGPNFGGKVQMSDLLGVIRNTQGVLDAELNNVIARADGTAFVDGTFLIQNGQVISRYWPMVAGYIIPETTMGETLADSLNFVAS